MPQPGDLTDADLALQVAAQALLPAVRVDMSVQAFHIALERIWNVISQANRYVDEQAPWALRKTDPARMATVLYVLADAVRHVAILAQPVMPDAMARLLDQLGVAEDARSFAALADGVALVPGTPLPKPQGVFPRYVEPEEDEAEAT